MPRNKKTSPGNLADRLEAMRKSIVKDDRADDAGYTLRDLIDVAELQKLLEVRDLPIGIMDHENRIIAAVKWQDICVKFHRPNQITGKRCLISDSYIKDHLDENRFVEYHCANGLWDIALPIIIEARHVGTIFIGQFFYTDDKIDYAFFEKQAAEVGFDWPEYKKVLDKVPRFTREQVKNFMEFNRILVNILAQQGLANLKLKREMEERSKAEARLRESEERWHFALEDAGDGIWDWNIATDKVIYSRRWKEMLGYGEDEIGDTLDEWKSRLHPDDRENVFGHIDKHLGSKVRHYTSEYRLRCKDGSYIWIMARGKIIEYDDQGEPVRMIGIHTNITERKTMEENLRISEERWSFALEGAGDGVWDWNVKTNVVLFSRRWKEMLGYSDDEIADNFDEWRKRVHPDDLDGAENEIAKYFQGKIPVYEIEHRLLCKDGTYRWILARGKIVERDEKGNPVRMIGTHSDITGRKHSEERLRESEKRYELIAKNTADVIWVLDMATMKFEYISPSVERLTGYSNTDFILFSIQDTMTPESYAVVLQRLPEAIRDFMSGNGTNSYYINEINQYKRDGSVIPTEIVATFMTDDNGLPVKILGVSRDVTDRIEKDAQIRQFYSIVNSSLNEVYVFDPETLKFIFVSNGARKNLGYSLDQLQKMTPVDIEPDFTSEQFESLIEPLKTEKAASLAFETRHERADGTVYPVEVHLQLLDVDKNLFFLSVILDITEKKETLNALKASDERLRLALEGTTDAVWDWRIEPELVYFSPSFYTQLAYEPGEFPASAASWMSMVHPDDLPKILEDFSSRRKGSNPNSIIEYRIRTKSGDWKWVLSRGRFVEWNQDGKPNRLIGLHTDIDDRKRAEEKLDLQLRIMETLLENLPMGVMMIEAESGKTLIENAEARQLFGGSVLPVFQEQTVHARTIAYKSSTNELYPPEEMPVFLGLKGTRGHVDDILVRRPDGTSVLLEVFGAPVFDKENKVIASITIFFDIADRKKAEEEKINLERQVQHAQKLESLGILAGGIAHDFNNILTAILGHASLALLDLPPESPVVDNLKEIEKAAHRAADLARQMLAYSGRGKFLIQEIVINDVVKEMIQLITVSVSKKITIRYALTENLPSIEADATQIRQIILNLITNASDAIGDNDGIITLSSGALYCDKKYIAESHNLFHQGTDKIPGEGNYVFFEVTDSGSGMTDEVLEKIFDPFYTTKFTGRGLGLAAVLGIIRGHQGLIRIVTVPGKGTSFRVLFPESRILKNTAKLLKKPDIPEEHKITGTILVIDDEESIREISRRLLERRGFHVILAADGIEALDILRKRKGGISLILLDMTMPKMDGAAVFRGIREIDKEVPVLLASGYSEQEATGHFRDKGLAGFIQKPFDTSKLVPKICSILEACK
ncbi:MAG: hypothetical protein A2Y33_00630 [Spirochaetes bacterium GWF1_51_8]|nr:MAG: hypothetical protein A2Y33_00630 [Spirochaetes bacterium GWF1_51_8]